MEQADRDGASRSQNIVYTAPRTAEALGRIVTPPLERVDPSVHALQVVILTPDADTALAAADAAATLSGARTFVPVTSANRAARQLADRSTQAVAGTPAELQALVQRNVLKLDAVQTVVVAWADEILAGGAEALSALESLFGDIPKDAGRALLAHTVTPGVEQLIERYLRKARRMDEPAEDVDLDTLTPGLEFITVSPTSRVVTLQRLLDELDPPSATILVRSAESQATAELTLRRLGYQGASDHIRVALDEVTDGTHLIVFFDAPVSAAAIVAAASAKPAEMVALLTPKELLTVRELIGSVTPFALKEASHAARRRDQAVRDELAAILARGVASREVLALEPLLEQYDGAEIAAAALHLLERERAQAAHAAAAPAPREERPRRDSAERPSRDRDRDRDSDDRPPRDGGSRPKRDADRAPRSFGDRPVRDFSSRPKREFGDRPKRDFGDRPSRDFGDRPKRDFGDRAPRDFGDRPKRDFGAKREFGAKRDFGPKRGPGAKRDFGGKSDFGPRRGGDARRGGRFDRDR